MRVIKELFLGKEVEEKMEGVFFTQEETSRHNGVGVVIGR